jgi:hypothetical protein
LGLEAKGKEKEEANPEAGLEPDQVALYRR